MHYTFDYDRAEFVRAQRAVSRHSESVWRHTGKAMLALALACAAGSVVTDFVLHHRGWASIFYKVAIWALIMALYVWIWSRIAGPWAARQMEKQRPDFSHPLSAGLDESGYECGSFSGTTRLNWAGIRRAVETPEFLLLYIMKSYAYYIPRRAIPPAELPAVRHLLREKLGERAMLMDG